MDSEETAALRDERRRKMVQSSRRIRRILELWERGFEEEGSPFDCTREVTAAKIAAQVGCSVRLVEYVVARNGLRRTEKIGRTH